MGRQDSETCTFCWRLEAWEKKVSLLVQERDLPPLLVLVRCHALSMRASLDSRAEDGSVKRLIDLISHPDYSINVPMPSEYVLYM